MRMTGQRRDRSLCARLKMSDEDVVWRFFYVVGVGNVTGPYIKPNRKPIWIWQSGSFEHVQAVMAMLWPWLQQRRRLRIKELLTLYHQRKAELSR